MRNGAGPLATVVLPFWNAERTLAAAIRSILLQTDTRWTLSLVDDGSTDGSLAVAQRFVSDRVLLLSDGRRLGISNRLNTAIDAADTRYICRMDADDIAFPQRLERQLALLEGNPELDVVASPVVVFSGRGELLGVVRGGADHVQICSTPWRGFIFPHPTWTGKTSWFKYHRYDPDDDGAEDQALLYRAHSGSCLATTDDVLLAYRESDRTFSKLLHRRLKFWRAIYKVGVSRHAWKDVILVSLFQPAKIAGDALNIFLRVRMARNELRSVPAALEESWSRIETAVR